MTFFKSRGRAAPVFLFILLGGCGARRLPPPPPPPVPVAPIIPAPGAVCDDSLWDHVYIGDRHKFTTAKDRLHVIEPCIAVTGTVFNAVTEKDGDFHIRITLDPNFRSLLNAENVSGQGGHLVVEPVCMNPVTQRDTKAEGVCNAFRQMVFDPSMKGKRVRIVGAYVTDMEHGWNEIHPVTSITLIP